MHRILRNLFLALGRIFPDCVTLSQAIAFNMFLAFFPLLLLALGLLSITSIFHDSLQEIPEHLKWILPPSSTAVVFGYFVRKGVRTWRWTLLGLAGTLLAGTQVMNGFIEGFRVVEGDLLLTTYWQRQFRALGMLCLTIVPILTVIILTVFGKQTRPWLMRQTGSLQHAHELELLFYACFVFLLAMAVLIVLYRIGRPGHAGYRVLFPGAAVSTVFWWAADISFGYYVRKMPYDFVYRGLAGAIGLLLWMFFTALIVLLGAAYNAESRESSLEQQAALLAHR